MTDHGRLLLCTKGACDLDPDRLLAVFGRQRQRFAAVLREFGPGDWAARFLGATDDLLAVTRDRLARSYSFDVRLPYGTMDWTILLLHGFWDSWPPPWPR